MCLLVSFPHGDAQSKYFHPHQPCCPSLNIPFSTSAVFPSRPSDQSCTQCCRGEGNSDLYKGTEIPLVYSGCVLTASKGLSLRSSQDLMMKLIHCLLKCAVAHSWKTAFVWVFSLPCLLLSCGEYRYRVGKSLLLDSQVPIPASSQPHACAPIVLSHNWLLIRRWCNSDQPWMIQGQIPALLMGACAIIELYGDCIHSE